LVCRNQFSKRLPVKKLHDEEWLPVVLAKFINRADVGMFKRRCRPGFTLKTTQRSRIIGGLLWQELDCDLAPELDVLGAIDQSHSATAQPLHDAVMGHDFAD